MYRTRVFTPSGQVGPNNLRNRVRRARRRAARMGVPLPAIYNSQVAPPGFFRPPFFRGNRRFPQRRMSPRSVNLPNTLRSAQSGLNLRGRPRQINRPNISNQSLTKTELWFDVRKGVHKYNFLPGTSGIPHLDRFASIYESFQLRHFTVQFRPSAGTTIPGNLTVGFDYEPYNDRESKDIPLLEPNQAGTIYDKFSLSAIVNRAMKNLSWLPTAAAQRPKADESNAFALYVNANTEAENIGQIWVTYKIAFCTATSPVGLAAVKPVPIVMSVTEQVLEKTILPPTSVVTAQTEDPPVISLQEGTTTSQTVEGNMEQTTKFTISEDIPVGQDFTVGNLVIGESASTPNVNFKYPDGTPVPADVIKLKQDSAPKLIAYGPKGSNSSVLAAVFSILKPLVRPVVMSLVDTFLPESSFNAEEVEDPATIVPAVCTAFAFPGDTATLTVPEISELPFASKLPFEFFFTMVRQFRPSSTNYTRIYQIASHSNPDRYAFSWRIEGQQPNQNVAIALRSPNKDFIFAPGDYVQLNFTLLSFDEGVSRESGALPQENIIPADKMKEISDYICRESTGDDETGFYKQALSLNYLSNRTLEGSSGRGVTIMFTLNGRANSLSTKVSTITFRIPAYLLAQSLPTIIPTCGVFPEGNPSPLRPAESLDFSLGVCMATLTAFPSRPMTTDRQYSEIVTSHQLKVV